MRNNNKNKTALKTESEIGTPALKFGDVGEAGYGMPNTENSGA